jgi:hypothetical protein
MVKKFNTFYGTLNSPVMDPILSHMNPIHTLVLHSFNIHFNINIESMKMDLRRYGSMGKTGFGWLRIGSVGGLL